MTSLENGCMLRLFISESDRHHGMNLHEWIVQHARESGLAGATVLRAIEGYGAHSVLHTTKVLRLAENLPLIIEIIDTEPKIEAFLQEIEPVIGEGLATLEPMQIRFFRRKD